MKLWSEVKEKMAARRVVTALGAVEIASVADSMASWLEAMSTGKGIEKLPKIDDTGTWLSLYRDHARLQNVLMRGMHPGRSWAIEPTELMRGIRAVIKMLQTM